MPQPLGRHADLVISFRQRPLSRQNVIRVTRLKQMASTLDEAHPVLHSGGRYGTDMRFL